MMSELKPCPFCGADAEVTDHENFKIAGCSNLSMLRPNPAMTIYNDDFSYWNSRVQAETEKRLTTIAAKHATRADELYEALESTNKELYFVINELNKYKTKDFRCDQLDPPELHDMETCHLNAVLLQKPTISNYNDD